MTVLRCSAQCSIKLHKSLVLHKASRNRTSNETRSWPRITYSDPTIFAANALLCRNACFLYGMQDGWAVAREEAFSPGRRSTSRSYR